MTDNLWTGVPVGALPADAYQSLVARVDIFDEAIVYTRFGQDGEARGGHQVSPADLAAALSGVPVATGLLPQGTLFYSRHAGGVRMGLYLPPRVHRLAVQQGRKRARLNVPLPPLVFVGDGSTYSVFAVKQYPVATERLYKAPLPNVYGDGKICPGNVPFPACSPATIRKAADLFLSSDFNTDLAGMRSQSHGENVLEMWQALHETGAETYPLDDLLKASHPGALSDVVGGGDV